VSSCKLHIDDVVVQHVHNLAAQEGNTTEVHDRSDSRISLAQIRGCVPFLASGSSTEHKLVDVHLHSVMMTILPMSHIWLPTAAYSREKNTMHANTQSLALT